MQQFRRLHSQTRHVTGLGACRRNVKHTKQTRVHTYIVYEY